MEIEGKVFYVYVLKRPGVEQFIKQISEYYEIVIYTASLAKYADPLVDLLDPHNSTSYRLFREHCTFYNNSYVKDLSQLGRKLKDVIIVDNSPNSYALQPENAVPITTWIDDPKDTQLIDLIPVLKLLALEDDVRPSIKKITQNGNIDYKQALEILRENNEKEEFNCDTVRKLVNAWTDSTSNPAQKINVEYCKDSIQKTMQIRQNIIEELLNNKYKSRHNNAKARHSQIDYEEETRGNSGSKQLKTPKNNKDPLIISDTNKKEKNSNNNFFNDFEKIIQLQEFSINQKLVPSTMKNSELKEKKPEKAPTLFTNLLKAKKENKNFPVDAYRGLKIFGDQSKSPKPVKALPCPNFESKTDNSKERRNRHSNSIENVESINNYNNVRKQLDFNSPTAAALPFSHSNNRNPFSTALCKKLTAGTPKDSHQRHNLQTFDETPKAKRIDSSLKAGTNKPKDEGKILKMRMSLNQKTTQSKITEEMKVRHTSIGRKITASDMKKIKQ